MEDAPFTVHTAAPGLRRRRRRSLARPSCCPGAGASTPKERRSFLERRASEVSRKWPSRSPHCWSRDRFSSLRTSSASRAASGARAEGSPVDRLSHHEVAALRPLAPLSGSRRRGQELAGLDMQQDSGRGSGWTRAMNSCRRRGTRSPACAQGSYVRAGATLRASAH